MAPGRAADRARGGSRHRDHADEPALPRSRGGADARQGGCRAPAARNTGAGRGLQVHAQGAAGRHGADRTSPRRAQGNHTAGDRRGDLHHTDTLCAGAEVGDRKLHGEVRYHIETAIRRRQHYVDDVARGLYRRRHRVADLRAEPVVALGGAAPAQRRTADDRSGHGIQPIEHVTTSKEVPGPLGRAH